MNKLQWNVYNESINRNEIKVFNVFDHVSFSNAVDKLRRKKLSRDEFSKELRSVAMYYFWSKCEYEVVITSWPPYIDREELERLTSEEIRYRCSVRLTVGEKIDVYQQLALNWDRFVDYLYTNL